MMLIKSTWNTGKTFRMIPVNQDCPYNECIYDPDQKVLAVISKECKETFQMVPKFNDKGDIAYLKGPRENGKNYAEERRVVDTWFEYYIEDANDIKNFVHHFASNTDSIVMATGFIDAPKAAQVSNVEMFEGTKTL